MADAVSAAPARSVPDPPGPAVPASAPAPASAATIPPPETPTTQGLMTLAVSVVIVAALYFGREVFIPIVLAVLLSFVLAPFVDLLRRWKFGRVPSVIIAVLVALGVIISLGGVFGLQVAQLVSDLPRYEDTIRRKVSGVREGVLARASNMMKDVNRQIEEATEQPAAPAAPRTGPARPEPQKPMPVEIRHPTATPAQFAGQVLHYVIAPLTTMGIVFVVLIFILMQREDLRDRMIRLFGSRDLHRTTEAMDDGARRLSRYFLTQLALNAGFGVLITAGLWLIGVPSPILWGGFAALMRFVPYVGSFVAAGVTVALAAAVDPNWTMALWTLALFLVTEPIMGHIVEPLAYGQSTGLSPFAVVVAAVFWTWLWGPIGLLLATPLTLCLVVLGRHVERLEFLDVLLGDRPALTPVENFYQRMLAGDPDEAHDHAEQLLKERSLSSYYDEVALKGLQLAANDLSRGALTERQLLQIKEGIKALVADLAEHEDLDPAPGKEADDGPAPPTRAEKEVPKKPALKDRAPPMELAPEWRGENAVLCVAGKGPLDEAASAMLAQLLRKHGISAREVPHEAVSRTNVIGFDVTGVMMVCVSYLEISGTPAHLRYLLRRLRQKLPDGRILVGLWPQEHQVLSDEQLRATLGADDYVSSLRDAVAACLDAAKKAAERHRSTTQAHAEPTAGAEPALLTAAAASAP